MKHLLLTTIAAVVLVGCGESQPTELPFAKAARISIHGAAKAGNIEAVKQHLAAGADVNAKDGIRWTPLHWAVYYGRKETVELLIAEGADVNAKRVDGSTPLDQAIKYNRPKFADLLRKHGGKAKWELKAAKKKAAPKRKAKKKAAPKRKAVKREAAGN